MTPPFLLLSVLLFWGWRSDQLVVAAVMGIILEGSRLVSWRWSPSPVVFRRLWFICGGLFFLILGILSISKFFSYAFLTTVQWLPLIFIPLVASQIYSRSGRVDRDVFFLFPRRRKGAVDGKTGPGINLAYPYFAVCLISAGTINDRTVWFYIVLCLIVGWSLWAFRAQRYSPLVWVSFVLFAAFIGYASQVQLHRYHVWWGDKMVEWMAGLDVDPFRAYTSLGDIGSMKLSGRILFRVAEDIKGKTPILLRDASYNIYNKTVWVAQNTYFRTLEPEADGETWNLDNQVSALSSVTVLAPLKGGNGILSLPNGTFRIENLPVVKMQQSNLGTVKVREGPGLVQYRAWFSPEASLDTPPGDLDLEIPEKLQPVLTQISEKLDLSSLSPQEIIRVIGLYFEREFKYSLRLRNKFGVRPLENFFLNTHIGHCEFFATATVLLLRKAGLPARYATGYSVREYHSREKMFVVRDRHAHAWALVYQNGGWRDFDTTPSTWAEIESEWASFWEPLGDLWSAGVMAFKSWRMKNNETAFTGYAAGFLAFITAVLLWKHFRKKRVLGVQKTKQRIHENVLVSGADSEFYRIVERLKEMGPERYPWEPLSDWIRRINNAGKEIGMDSLGPILDLHYRCRFDPLSLSEGEKEDLRSGVQVWLKKMGQQELEGERRGMD